MDTVGGAVLAIAIVLSAVFIPTALWIMPQRWGCE
jgi:multidrug efflux pump subunit AcrB